MKTVFYVPVYDQIRELPGVLEAIADADLEDVTFLLVDNGSSDGSEELIAQSDHPTLHLPVNRGVGYGYIRAIDWALERDFDLMGTIASNGKMLPGEIPRLLAPLREGRADYVTGSRFLASGASPNLPRFRRATIPLVNRVVRLTTGARVTDATNGFRAFRLELLRRAQFEWHGEWLHTYAFEYFLYAKALLAKNVRTLEVPTTMRYPKSGPYSKIRPGVDYVAMLKPWVMARLIPGGFA